MANARDKFSAIAAYLEREHDTRTIMQYGKPTIVYNGESILAFAYDSLGVKLHGRAMDHLVRLPETRGWNPIAMSDNTAPGWVLVTVRHFYRWDKIAMDALHCMRQAQAGGTVRYAAVNDSAQSVKDDSSLANQIPQALDNAPAVTPKSIGGSWADRLKSALNRISDWKIG